MSVQPYGVQPAHQALSADDPREIGGYRLHARLGSGGMGEVYLAHTPGGRPIALKAVRREFAADPAFRERFAREVASARRIHGLFTAQVVDFGVDERTPWLATAYVPGPSLDEVVRRHGPLPSRTVLLLVAGIAEALQAIHGAGVVHRDLKPANVLLAGDGPRVIDFGIAHAAGSAALTGTGLRIGTAAFMAPEQALGRPVTPATDVFALGALTAYVAGGQPPFGGGPESTALYRVVHEHPDLSRVPAELEQLVRWCLAKEPADRPTTAELIGYVHAHPGVGPRPEFTEGWLPRPVQEEVGAGRDAVRPAAPAPYTPPAPHAPTAPSAPVAPAPGPTPVPEAGGGGRRAARRRGRGRLPAVAATAAVTLAACGAALYWFDTAEPGGGSADGFVPGYTGARLTAPDAGYEFDLEAGKVVPADTATWYLAPEGRSFVPSESSDVHLAEGAAPTPADCEQGIATKPVTALPFSALGERRPFCVRSPDHDRIVVVRLVEAAADGSVTILVDQYHRE